jgi:hypothetical protein
LSNRPANVTQAAIARVLRAVNSSGVPARIDVKPDGTISIVTGLPEAAAPATAPEEHDASIVL